MSDRLTPEQQDLITRIERGDVLWEDMEVDLDILHVDHEHYQRGVRPEHVAKIINEYNPLLMEPPLVNIRDDGVWYVMEGQHRVIALRELRAQGKHGIGPTTRCRVFVGLSLAEEALIFNMQDARRPLTPIERFRAGLVSGREPYVSVNARVEACGWEVARYPKDGGNTKIDAINALIRLVENYEGTMLERVLTTARDAWGLDRAPTHSIMAGMAQFFTWYEKDINEKQFLERLREMGRDALTQEAEKRRVLDHVDSRSAVGMTLVNIYNYNRPNRTRIVAWETKALEQPGSSSRRLFAKAGAGERKRRSRARTETETGATAPVAAPLGV
jgi:hypothetical protein